MSPYELSIYYRFPSPAMDSIHAHLVAAHQLLDVAGSFRTQLLPDKWFVAGDDAACSNCHAAFNGTGPSSEAVAVYEAQYKKDKDGPKLIAIWNAQEERTEGAYFSDHFQVPGRSTDHAELVIDSISSWCTADIAISIMKEACAIYLPRAMTWRPVMYKSVFPDKVKVAWMLYLPVTLATADLPEARRLEPVVDQNGNRIGTIIVSVTDSVLDEVNEEQTDIAHQIEIRLADNDLLTSFSDI